MAINYRIARDLQRKNSSRGITEVPKRERSRNEPDRD